MRYLFFLFLILTGLEIYFYIDFLNYSYGMILENVSSKYDRSFQIERFPLLFTEQRYENLHVLIPLILLGQIIALVILYRLRKRISTIISEIFIEVKEIYTIVKAAYVKLTITQWMIFGCISFAIIVSRVYMIDAYPFSGDEAFTYYTFVHNGFLMSISFYPEPNNHILYTLIALFFDQFITDPLYVLRIPVILIDLGFLGLGFSHFLGIRNFTSAILFLIISGFAFSTTIYALHGRGYILVCFFTFVSTISAIRLSERPGSKLALWSLIMSGILGMYTITIFLLIIGGVCSYLLFLYYKKRESYLLLFAKYILIVTVGWVLLYLPVFLVSGFDTVFKNKIVGQYDDMHYYFTYIIPVASVEAIDFIVGTYSKGYLLFIVISAFVFYTYMKCKDDFIRNTINFSVISILSFVGMMIMKRIFAEPRVFVMYGFILAMVLALCISYYLDKIKNGRIVNAIIIAVAIFFISLIPLTFEKKMDTFYANNYLSIFENITKDVDLITKDSTSAVYVTTKGHLEYLNLYDSRNPDKISIYTQNSKQTRVFDYLILDQRADFPETVDSLNYRQVKAYTEAWIYKRK